MSPQSSLDLDEFLNGATPLFFVAPKGKDATAVHARDFSSRKRAEGLAILCWQQKVGADSFIEQINASRILDVVSLTGGEFKGVCERSKLKPSDLLLELQA